jgi:hypothetical protein
MLAARPLSLPLAGRQETADGGLRLSVRCPRPRWHRWLGAGADDLVRHFELDVLGREVYEACDGTRAVTAIVDGVAARHRLSVAEAEIAVITFLNLLVSRGLVALAVDTAGDSGKENGA